MKRLLLILIIILTTGCVNSMVRDAVDAAEETIAQRWKEEWKPALATELKLSANQLKDEVLEEAKKGLDQRLDKLEIDPAKHDRNKDGKYSPAEAIELAKELKKANDKKGSPFSLLELAAVFAAVYAGGSGIKGGVRSVMKKKDVA